jgi:hypothetical protein
MSLQPITIRIAAAVVVALASVAFVSSAVAAYVHGKVAGEHDLLPRSVRPIRPAAVISVPREGRLARA